MRRAIVGAALASVLLVVGTVAFASHGNPNEHIDTALGLLGQAAAELEAAKADALPPVTVTETATVTTTETITVTASATNTPSPSPSPTTPPPATVTEFPSLGHGRFSLGCDFSHREQVDPIVVPGQLSAHMHDFFGNVSTNRNSTYNSMIAAATNCSLATDTAGYWAPTLVAPDGSFVEPVRQQIYYRNRPFEEGPVALFPPDFRIIAGGVNASAGKSAPVVYWNCDGESDGGIATRQLTIPNCTGTGNGPIEAHVYFPTCWDGRSDSPDHRSHMTYASPSTSISDSGTCPAGFPFRLPQLDIRILYPVTNGTGYRFSDGETLIHMDFWNTWQQADLERLTRDCLAAGVNCGGL